MPGELAEGGQIRVGGFEVADVGLILDDRYAIDVGGRRSWRVAGFPESALRGMNAIAHAIHGYTGIEIVEIPWVEVVFLNGGLLMLVEEATYPLIRATGFRRKPDFLRPRLVVELLVADHQYARIRAIVRWIKKEIVIQGCHVALRHTLVLCIGRVRRQCGEAEILLQV